jgi:NAD(P)-dependent dehydrogenase (short-subunit alcohol dehydrogenase family)
VSNESIKNYFDLSGRVILLTGAAGHLGSVIALGLCKFGATLIINDNNNEKLISLYERLRSCKYNCFPIVCDLQNDASLKIMTQHIRKKYKHLDGIINNAFMGKTGIIEKITDKDFSNDYHITVISAFRLIQELLPLLKKTAKKNIAGVSIVNVGSMYGTVSPDQRIYGDSDQNNPPQYGAAKAALIQLSKYLACHLAPFKIRVNSVSPGPFPNLTVTKQNKKFYKKLCDKCPMGRIGLADELVGPMVFLLSDASSYVTGINLSVDGGWTAW